MCKASGMCKRRDMCKSTDIYVPTNYYDYVQQLTLKTYVLESPRRLQGIREAGGGAMGGVVAQGNYLFIEGGNLLTTVQ